MSEYREIRLCCQSHYEGSGVVVVTFICVPPVQLLVLWQRNRETNDLFWSTLNANSCGGVMVSQVFKDADCFAGGLFWWQTVCGFTWGSRPGENIQGWLMAKPGVAHITFLNVSDEQAVGVRSGQSGGVGGVVWGFGSAPPTAARAFRE